MAFSPNGTILAVACGDSWVYLWDLATDKVVGQVSTLGGFGTVAFSPDGKLLALVTAAAIAVRLTSKLVC
jgi:WD40 repeat protein